MAALTITLGACDDDKRAAERAEAERIVQAARALREAEGEQKVPRLAALAALPCNDVEVCRLRDVCKESGRLYLAGVDATRAVRHELGNDAGVDAGAATRLLARAESDVKKAKQLGAECADAEGAVRRRFGLP